MSKRDQVFAQMDEIAFLLERGKADRHRTAAFRNAMATVAGLSDADFQQRAQTHSFESLPGIGKVTATVIDQALAGEVPQYRAKATAQAPPFEDTTMYADLRGDLHSHSNWSDGTVDILKMAHTAQSLGRQYQALTDHSPRLTVANGLSPERLRKQFDVVAAVNRELDTCTLLTGIEVDILENGSLDQTPELLQDVDVVVASVHWKLRMKSHEMTPRMIAAIANPNTNVLGHCTNKRVITSRGRTTVRPPSEFDADAVFDACAAHDVAVEINSQPARSDPPDDLIVRALEKGCLFSIDSDAHAPGELSLLDMGAARAQKLGVPPERVVNTWPLDRLRSWLTGGQ